MSKTISVCNEWGSLKEIIVGTVPDKMIVPAPSYSMAKYLLPEVLDMMRSQKGREISSIMPQEFRATQQQIENLCQLLEKQGVKVHRARAWTKEEEEYVETGGAPLYVRDPLLLVGKNVIELSLMTPYRRKEIFAVREILEHRVNQDPEAAYVSMPPALPHPAIETAPEGRGPFLEGGDVFVLDRDILVGNSGLASNTAGIAWLRRYLQPQGYRVHEVRLAGCWLHLDCVLSIARRGLAVVEPTALLDGLPKPMKDWKLIEATRTEAHALGCNSICLEENIVLIGEEHERIIKELKKESVEIVTTPMNAVSVWGGGIRCSTNPLRREK